jgi:hypothetical protein
MSSRLYAVYNGAAPGAAAQASQASGAVVRTMMQLATATTGAFTVIEVGCSFDGFTAAQPGKFELIAHAGGPCTAMTAYAAADIARFAGSSLGGAAAGLATTLQLGTALSGFNTAGGAAEVTPTTPRLDDFQLLPPTAPYIKQFPGEFGPQVGASEFLRTRLTFGTTVNVVCYVVFSGD